MAKAGNKKGKGRKKRGGALYDPTRLLSGKPLARIARATTRIETLPAIRAKRFQMGQSRRDQAREEKGLSNLGQRLQTQSVGVANRLGQYSQENLANQQKANELAQQRLAANAQASTDRLNQLQSGVLGQQISSLTAQNVGGGGATDAAIARLAAQQQGSAAASNQSWGNMAAAAAANSERQAINFGAAQQNEAANQQIAMARAIATRIGDAKAAGSEERRALRNELGTLKATKGATYLKNLMAFRREQQQYGNERAQTLATIQQNQQQNALDWAQLGLERQKEANDQANGGSSGGSSGGRPDSLSISPEEWKNWKTAADDYLDGGRVKNWNNFISGLESQPGVSFSAVERKKFKRKYRQLVRKRNKK